MSFLDTLLNLGKHQPVSQATPATGIHQPNGSFTAPAPRTLQMNLPQAQSPQNLSQYGNAQGQHWLENGQGQRFAMPTQPQMQSPADQRLLPPHNPYNRPVIAQPQYQDPRIKQVGRII